MINQFTQKQQYHRPDLVLHRKTIVYSVLVLLFVALVVLSSFLMFRFEFWQTPEKAINSVASLVLLVFDTILFAFCAADRYEEQRPKNYFLANITVLYFTIWSGLLVCLLNGLPQCAGLLQGVSTVSYFVGSFYWGLFWLYLKCYYPPKKNERLIHIFAVAAYVFYSILIIVNLHTGIFFIVDENGIVQYNQNDIVSTILAAGVVLIYLIYIFRLQCDRRTKWSLASYSLLPALTLLINAVVTIRNEIYNLDWFTNLAVLLPLYLIFFNVYLERSRTLLREEARNTELRTAVMISQIQPHFLYNSLTTIAALCESNPREAKEATVAFSEYLRGNMDAIDRSAPVTLTAELEHVKTYLWLEQLRFQDKLQVEYDIQAKKFLLPALSLQPIVENAVKHGICGKKGGGTVKISTRETDSGFVITVTDNGVGFDPDMKPDDGRQHIGIGNVRNRLAKMVHGTLSIRSLPGVGTKAEIYIPKER